MPAEQTKALALTEDFVDRVVDLQSDEQRSHFFRNSPFLRTRQVAERLARAVTARCQVDVRQAESLSRTALWLAREIGDQNSLALATRARANTLHISGQNAEALELYRSAATQFASLGDRLEEAITLSNGLASLVHLQFNRDAALWAERARSIFQEEGDELRLARLELNYANVHFRQDRWEEAASGFAAAYEVLQRIGNPQDIAICLSNRAVCHKELNQVTDALHYYAEARHFAEQHGVRTLIPTIDYNVSYLHFLSGRYTDAIEGYQRTREAFASIGDEYHESLCNLDLGAVYLELNLLTEASGLLMASYEGFEAAKMPFEKARSLTTLAIAMHRSRRPFVAAELLKLAEAIFREHDNRFWTPLTRLCRAQILLSVGRHQEAKSLASEATRDFEAIDSQRHVAMSLLAAAGACRAGQEYARADSYIKAVFDLLDQRDNPRLQFQSSVLAGRLAEDQGQPSEAMAHYTAAAQHLGRLRNQVAVEDLNVPQFPRGREIFEDLVVLTLRTGMERRRSQELFRWIEAAKTRTTAGLMASRATPTMKRPGQSTQANSVQQLREELNWYYRQIDLQGMRSSGRSEEEVRKLEQLSRDKEQALLRTLKTIGADGKDLLALESPSPTPALLQESLSAGEMIVDYFVARNVVLAAIVTDSSYRIQPLATVTRVNEMIERLRLLLLRSDFGGDSGPKRSQDRINKVLRNLYDDLIRPVMNIEMPKRLIVVPDRVLYYTPFHALFDGEHYLYERCEVCQTTRAHVSATSQKAASTGTLVLGLPTDRAPFIVDEVKAVSEAAPNSILLVGKAASLETIWSDQTHKSVVHISTVGEFRSDNPMFSTIDLGAGRLNLFDFAGLNLQTDLVVLSGSCAPALSPTDNGEQMLALAEGIRASGVPCAVLGMWKQDHPGSAVFMKHLHLSLAAGESPERALNRAIAATRREVDDVYCWAGHALYRWPQTPQTTETLEERL